MQIVGSMDIFILYFLLYSCAGYICEVVYCSIGARKIVNRGFLRGPYLPIYGFGALAVIVALEPFKTSPVVVFIGGVVLTSALEYLGSWLLERLFNIKLWDYSRRWGNINGRVCLRNSFLFGLMALVLMYWLHPSVEDLVARLPEDAVHVLAFFIVLLLTVDTTASVFRMVEFRRMLEEWKEKMAELQIRLDILRKQNMGQNHASSLRERLQEEMDAFKDRLHKRSVFFMHQFPTMSSRNKDFQEYFEMVRDMLKSRVKTWETPEQNATEDKTQEDVGHDS